jgi:hypothetical protein
MEKRRRVIIAVLLLLTIVNFTRLTGSEDIRAIEFLSIFAIGALSALLINEFVTLLNAKRK